MYVTKEKIVTLNVTNEFCMQARNILINLARTRPHLQLCRTLFFSLRRHFGYLLEIA